MIGTTMQKKMTKIHKNKVQASIDKVKTKTKHICFETTIRAEWH